MAARRSSPTTSVEVYVDRRELAAVLSACNKAGKEVSAELRDASLRIADGLAGHLRRSALDPYAPPQAALLLPTIKPVRDRIVKVNIGGARRVGRPYRSRETGRRTRAQAGALVWGSETGSDEGVDRAGRAYTNRYSRPGLPVSSGYWIQPTVAAYGDEARRAWWDAVEDVLRRAGFTVTRDRGGR